MVKKVREYKSGDFIFAKVKGYPAWPARVQGTNGKRYFVYFYGTGETANLPPNMIFDYAENKDKFLTKSVKRRHFVNGVKQIEHDFANNVPLEQVIGVSPEDAVEAINNTANDTANETTDDTAADTTAADDTTADESAQNETGVEDSDETGALVIDEGKAKGKKSKPEPKTPAKDTPSKAKSPRGNKKKEEAPKKEDEEEIVSRSGRKIRPKRYMDEQTEENATLPSPAPKKRRLASPAPEKDKEGQKEKEKTDVKERDKTMNAIAQSELEDLKEPFKPEDPEKDNILIACLPSGQYVGIKLFQSRPTNFKNEASKLQWDRQAASNAIKLKLQLERGQITAQSIQAQLIMDLNLTDEEKSALDKEKETEEKKYRVQFLKTEMKLIEVDAKIKSCLSLDRAETDMCLKLIAELAELDVKRLMIMKHPDIFETARRLRNYVGNLNAWNLTEPEIVTFAKEALKIRIQANLVFQKWIDLYDPPDREKYAFHSFYMDKLNQFRKAVAHLSPDELLELVHEPLEITWPTSHTMKAARDAANEEIITINDSIEEDEETPKTKSPAKIRKCAPGSSLIKRSSARKLQQEEKEKQKESTNNDTTTKEKEVETGDKEKEIDNIEKEGEITSDEKEDEVEKEEETPDKMDVDEQTEEKSKKQEISDSNAKESEKTSKENESTETETVKENETSEKESEMNEKEEDKDEIGDDKNAKKVGKTVREDEKSSKEDEKSAKEEEKGEKEEKKSPKEEENITKEDEKNAKEDEKSLKGDGKSAKETEKGSKGNDKSAKDARKSEKDSAESKIESKGEEKEKEIVEPRARRSRESKKPEPPPPRSPAKGRRSVK